MSLDKLRKKLVKSLPKWLRSRLMRHCMPPLSLNVDKVIFRPADTFDHCIKSFRLVHDVYVDSGYITPSPTALRIIPHHSHPDSRVFLGMFSPDGQQELPIYTVSLFPDSPAEGLPMDIAFKKELDPLREQGRLLAEAGCLASEPLFRKKDMNIPMLGNRLLLRYAMEQLGVDDLVITTHPKYLWVYEDILLFEKIGEVSRYGYVNDNPAVALRLNLQTVKERSRKIYGSKPKTKNVYHFFFEGESASTIHQPIPLLEERTLYETILWYYASTLKNGG